MMARSDNSVQFEQKAWINTTLTPMKRCIRRQRGGRCRRGPKRARAVLQFRPNVLLAKIEELCQCLLRVRVRNTFNELVDSTDSIQSHVVTRIVEDHFKDHVVKAIRKVNADLATSARYSIDDLY